MKMAQLLISMKQKSPELEIPEGIFYDGIPNCNLFVQKKNMETGKLYGIMIYRMTGSYEDQAIILADSGMLQSTEEKKHLVLSLWSGEWFENMQSSELANSAAVPYRRESFIEKKIILDYDGGFNMTDVGLLSGNAKGKSLSQITQSIDSLNHDYDSIGRNFYREHQRVCLNVQPVSKQDSLVALKRVQSEKMNVDSAFEKLSERKKQEVINRAMSKVQSQVSELDFQSMFTSDADRTINLQ